MSQPAATMFAPIIEYCNGAYDLGPFSLLEQLATKGQRIALHCASPRGEFVVKLSDPHRSEQVVRADVETPRALALRGFPAPNPAPGRDGRLYYPFEDRFLYLYPWLPGCAPRPSAGLYPRLGALLARLHSQSPDPTVPQSLYRPQEIQQDIAAALQQAVPSPMRTHALALLAGLPDFTGLPAGLIHSDPYLTNLLDDGQSLYLIDWEDAGLSFPLLDVAYVLAYLTVFIPQDAPALDEPAPQLGPSFHADWAAAFLNAYTQTRPLSEHEWRLLPAAIHLSHLLYLVDGRAVISENYQRMLLVDWDAFCQEYRAGAA